MEKSRESFSAEVERTYAAVLERVSMVGIAAIAGAYLLYVLHALPLSVQVHDIAANWHLGADALVAKGLSPSGWSWVAGIGNADILSLAAIGLLTMTPVVCLAAASASFLSRKDYAYTIIGLLQILVLLVAISGVLTFHS
ncbi:hypothetical protein CHL67_00310 [Prosthecochloris sp. GSB1]|uniref:DUF1634 domain-containing protein n=1 Tax=Prosthecochloris sp. GSB1 TaxID=281093 RepID=UPI000B8C90E2|nr:DUF1634 domain-containing protein [Prosthecochloris sp. GSB1]ASQ89583.1 hypothetical protein CHL67_00310 [Prosthecochloris sp. GSB1]